MNTISQQATDIARQIKKELRAAIKRGELPQGTKVSARKSEGSMCCEVWVKVTTPDPSRYRSDSVWKVQHLTDEGRQIALVISKAVEPHTGWTRDRTPSRSIDVSLDRTCIPNDPKAINLGAKQRHTKTETALTPTAAPKATQKPTVRQDPNTGRWVVDPLGYGRNTPDPGGACSFDTFDGALHEVKRRAKQHVPQHDQTPRLSLLQGGRAG